MENIRRKSKPPSRAALLLGIALSLGLAQAQISYQYDSLGRLTYVSDAAGGVAIYSYDAVGNILSIRQIAAGGLGIISVSPAQVSIGRQIEITGTGFSATASQNTVKVNGLQIPVTSATTTRLLLTIPAGTTSGPLTVQVGSVTASGVNLTIRPTVAASLAVKAIKPGEVLTITTSGLPFPTTDPNLKVSFNGGSELTPNSVSATTLTVTAPTGFSDGPVAVNSTDNLYQTPDLYNMPPSATASSASVEVIGRYTVGAAAFRATSAAANSAALIRLPLTTGDFTLPVTPQLTTATGTLRAELFDPLGVRARTWDINLADAQGLHVNASDITAPGTYTLVLSGTQSPNFDVNVVGVDDASVPVSVGSTVNFTTAKPGQYIKLPFGSVEPGPIQLALSNVTLSGAATLKTISGANLDRSTAIAAGNSVIYDSATPYDPLPRVAKIAPNASSTISGTLTATGTRVGTEALGATPGVFTAAFPTQWYTRQVTTVTSQAIGISLTDVTQPGGSGNGGLQVNTPNGSFYPFYSSTFFPTLIIPDPGAGQTRVTATPLNGATSNMLTLHVGPSTLLVAGAVSSAMTGNANANTFGHFNVSAADKVQVVINNLNFGGATGQGRAYLQRPGNYYTYSNVSSGADLIFRADGAVASGIYALTVDPPVGGSVAARVKLMTANPTVADDQVAPFSTTTANDTVIHNFTAAAASPRYLLVQGLTYSGATGNGKISVFMPNGNSTSIVLPTGSNRMFPNLNQDGTHSVMVVPPAGGTVAGNIIASPGQNLAKAAVTPVSLAAGQGKVLTFTGVAATSPSVTLSSLSPAPTAALPVKVVVFRPDGNTVASSTLTSASGTLSVPAITTGTAGTYVVGVFPTSNQPLAFNVVQDTAAPIPTLADDQLVSFSTATANEAFTRNFNSTSTPRYLLVQGLAYTGATGNGTLALLQPNNNTTSVALPTASNWMFGNLSQNGTYNVKLTPPSGGKVSGRMMASTGTALTTGVQATLSAAAGQGKVLTFAAAAGTTPKLTFATLSPVPTTAAPVTVVVFRPDGNRVASATYTSSTSPIITLPAVTAATAGTYTVGVFPPNGQALSFKVTRN